MASKLTRADVAKIAELARLDLSPKEIDLFATQLTAILEYAAVVEQVDTSSVTAEVPAADEAGAAAEFPREAGAAAESLREDAPAASVPREQVLAQAPDAATDAGFVRVPKVL